MFNTKQLRYAAVLKDTVLKGSSIDLALHALDQSKPSKEEIDQLAFGLQKKRKEQIVSTAQASNH